MNELQKMYYDKRGPVLVKNLQSRHFDAFYCSTKEEVPDPQGPFCRLGRYYDLPANWPH